MDKFVEYDFDRGFWFDLFLNIGVLVSKVPELSARNGDLWTDYIKEYSHLEKEYGEKLGENDSK